MKKMKKNIAVALLAISCAGLCVGGGVAVSAPIHTAITASADTTYTVHNVGALTFHVNSTVGGAKDLNNTLYLQRADGEALPILSWDYEFVYESGDGFRVNGVQKTPSGIKSTGDGFYWTFDALNAGDVITISGTFVCESQAVKYVIEESKFTWNGSAWEVYKGPIEYATYEIGKVVFSSGSNTAIYLDKASGETFEVIDGSWAEKLSFLAGSGVGVTLNDEQLAMDDIKIPNNIYIGLGVEAQAGDVLVIGGTFYNTALAVKYVIEESEMTYNGTTWETKSDGGDEGGSELPPAEYTTHEIGALTFHVNSTVGGAKGLNDTLYLQRADGEALPILSWEYAFAVDTGYFKINDEVKTPTNIKSTGDGFYWTFDALNAGDVVTISGTFVCESQAVKYVIEESKFTWNGSAWEVYVAYTTHEVGQVILGGGSSATAVYLDRADGEAFEIVSTENDVNWTTAFSLRAGSGVGITLNGVQISMNDVKFPNNMYVGLGVEAQAGDVLVIGGTFYSATLAVEYVIEESELVFNGTTWVDALSVVKDAGKGQLDAHLASFVQSDYYEAEWASLHSIVATAKASIDTAKTEDSIEAIVAQAKSDMDEVLTKTALDSLLAGVKTSAKNELAAYKQEKDYKEAEWSTIEEILTSANAKIDGAKSEAEIASAVEEAKTAMDEVETAEAIDAAQLKTWRADAKKEVQEYYEALNLTQYSSEVNATISGYVADARAAIDEATDKAKIDEILAEFKKNIENATGEKIDVQDDSISSSTDEEKSGCGNVVVGSGYALGGIGLAAAAIAAIRKKKENE